MPAGGLGGGLTYSPDGRTLALDSGSGDVLLWDTRSHRVTGRIRTGQASPLVIKFSPDGKLLATAGGSSTIELWTVPRLGLLADMTLPAPAAPANGLPLVVNEAAFGPGHTLVATTSYGTAQVWDLRPADEVRELCDALRGPSLARQWRQLTPAPDPCRAG
jgi:WD40 repeat protein